MTRRVLVTLLLLITTMLAPATALAGSPTPRDIKDFAERRDDCEYWGGEEPYDEERRADINAATAQLNCNSLHSDWKNLNQKYSGNVRLRKILKANKPD